MTFYHTQLIEINRAVYPKDHLTKQIIQAKWFIDDRFDEKLQIDRMAREAFLSKFYFIRLFKSYYGIPPYQYLTSVRIENAKRLLKNGLPLSDVCTSVGFESVTSFIGLFKKMTGSTPAVYQIKNSNSQELVQ